MIHIYKKYCLAFSLFRTFVLLFLFRIYEMVDIMDIYKSLNISIATVIKNPEMLKFVPGHLKIKNV